MSPSKVELLAPAGDFECLKAAVLNGADAVYFGLPEFNARRRAENFTLDGLGDVLEYLHSHNVKGYVTFNTLVFSSELEKAQNYLIKIAEAGVDAVIIQDIGMGVLLKKLCPELEVHASTQMSLSDALGVKFAQELGVTRAILARELSLEELKGVTTGTEIELEIFVHGALCVSYSGQCLASHLLSGRSANRGMCSQPCRMPYETVVNGKSLESDVKYVMSPLDLAAITKIDEILNLGITGLKIEGRLKNKYYVAAAVGAYRKAIDNWLAGKKNIASAQMLEKLALSFSRGFTSGYLEGKDNRRLVEGKVPDAKGLEIGAVTGRSGRAFRLRLTDSLQSELAPKPGDGILVEATGDSREQGGRIYRIDAIGQGEYVVVCGPGEIDGCKASIGAKVFKTDDPALRKELDATMSVDRLVHPERLDVIVNGRAGGALEIITHDREGNSVTVNWAGPVEVAQKHPLTAETVRAQFGRLGGTPFELGKVHLNCPDNLMVPKSVLNDLRRQAVEIHIQMRRQRRMHAIKDGAALFNLRSSMTRAIGTENTSLIMSVVARSIEQAQAIAEWANANPGCIGVIYCDFKSLEKSIEIMKLLSRTGQKAGLTTIRVYKPGDENELLRIADSGPDCVLVRNLAALEWFEANRKDVKLTGDFSLNVANEISAEYLINKGLSNITPCYELCTEEIQSMAANSNAQLYEPIVYAHVPLFYTEYCVHSRLFSRGTNEQSCGQACKSNLMLKDCKGLFHIARVDHKCRNTVYSGNVFRRRVDELKALRQAGITSFRLEMLSENKGEVMAVLDEIGRALK